ncbi:bifunctional [glutamine synthetase] adenylyltransferase/[glutamine synthetase]-adenylyl-L-tyrosine phosphorylase [Sphingomonas sp.]|uniref:bifunctional [glutamine synthetase] adenylyltransferase/[glutamine synthetase]-adenylyl-L-tyrosine phosphorylase n=1 Tax=Sphingomonas sp. TaxID=28214 RepID=UPI00286D6D6D|nr:bifunctional [glutamine synthetase] adenylyltransferase/[glutamine synthetase]-adenylyl-L-tyrosine phosphorylase [Sphingomonas sp.]
MNNGAIEPARSSAIDRAQRCSPFLREAITARPDLAQMFVADGAEAAAAAAIAAGGDSVDVELRVRRLGLALSVALGDLAGELPLERVTALLSDFADAAIDRALGAALAERVPDAPLAGITVIALGKLGSRELNYSSDVDLLVLFDPATMPRRERDDAGEAAVRVGRRMIEILQQRTADGYVARVDLRLRPSPEVTPIVLPLNAAISYYESAALPWERAAFIRARAAAGDIALGERFIEAIRPFVWRRSVDFGAIEEIRQISTRIRDHYAQVQAFGAGFDLKRGRGGIREAEFFTQVQQLVHGGREPALREPATLDALAALAAAGRLEPDVAKAIGDGYRRLRTVEHRVQMIDDQQTHRLPLEPDALEQVAALDGLDSSTALIDSLAPHVEAIGTLFDGLVTESGEILSNDPDILRNELEELGFGDAEQPLRRISEWRSGKPRSLRSPAARAAFEAMLPTLMRAVAAGPDPNHALNRFADIVDRLSSGVNLYRLLEARPQLARHLALILTHAPLLADQLARRPDLFDGLIDESSFALPPEPAAMADRLRKAMAGAPYDQALDRARLLINERRFALGAQLVAGHADALDVALGYSNVAEGTVVALAELAAREFAAAHGVIKHAELLILGLGRLGGRALTHASDLDIIYLFDAPEGAVSEGAKPLGATDYFNRLANRVTAALSVPTAAGPLYDVDTRLRPQGAKGMLAVPLHGFIDYQRDEAWTWEHMALCRARPVFGSAKGQAKLAAAVKSILCKQRDSATVRADAAKMRSEMLQHKPPSGPLDIKLGPGGLVDLEFAVHTLQLIHHEGLDPRLEYAIAGLAEADLIDPAFDPDLRLLSRMLVVMRLVSPDGGEPAGQSRALTAALCGHDDWDALLAAHDAARHRIADLWNKVKDTA